MRRGAALHRAEAALARLQEVLLQAALPLVALLQAAPPPEALRPAGVRKAAAPPPRRAEAVALRAVVLLRKAVALQLEAGRATAVRTIAEVERKEARLRAGAALRAAVSRRAAA